MATEYQKCGLTQHQMVCVGLGLPITERLKYSVEYSHPRIIGTLKAYYLASSEQNAEEMFTFDRPGMEIVRVTLL
ncbi:MAG: hypothetical protein ACLQVL_36735 [Terriglobia bacterium]